jgi:hypothetical protein
MLMLHPFIEMSIAFELPATLIPAFCAVELAQRCVAVTSCVLPYATQ